MIPTCFVGATAALSVVKDLLAVLGGCIAIFAAAYGVWSAIRKRREAKQQRAHAEDLELNNRFVDIETAIRELQTAAKTIQRQYADFKTYVDQDLKSLVNQITEIKAQCTRHQQANDVSELQRDMNRLINWAEQFRKELSNLREQVADKYLTVQSYQADLAMWTSNFDAMRQHLRDMTLLLNRRDNNR